MVSHNITEEELKGKRRILFVCLGNICRSPAAEGIMKSIVEAEGAVDFAIDSAGTARYHIGELPDHRMRIHVRRRGIELDHHCRQVTSIDFEDFDLVIGMDDSNLANLRRIAPSPEAERKILGMSEFFNKSTHYDYVPDPYYEGAEGFELVLDLLEEGCRNLYKAVSER